MTDPISTSLRLASFKLPIVNAAAFSMNHEVQGDVLVVYLRGNADSDVAALFADYLQQLHDEVVRAGFREVTLDFRELYFLTSSCIKGLVVAIKRLAAMDARSQYKINLVTTSALRWQERSFEVLCQLAPLLVRMRPQ